MQKDYAAMSRDEAGAAEDRSLDEGEGDGDGDGEGDGRSVSTLDIEDAAAPVGLSGASDAAAKLCTRGDGGANADAAARRESAFTLRTENGDAAPAAVEESGGGFQYNMTFWSIAFVALSLVFVVIIVAVSFWTDNHCDGTSCGVATTPTPVSDLNHTHSPDERIPTTGSPLAK